MTTRPENPAREIRHAALKLGFAAVGFSSPTPRQQAAERYKEMIAERRHGEMDYLERGLTGRLDPHLLLEGVQTIVSLAISYHTTPSPEGTTSGIARYARIADYHQVVRERAEALLLDIEHILGKRPASYIAVDSAPVMEKEYAEKGGIGRTGKNTLLIVPSAGSYVFLAELLIDEAITEERPPLPNPCGSCTICIDACPTGALLTPGKLDATRCISYLTVELKREFTAEEAAMTGSMLFGCDACQEHCPHNQRPLIAADPAFAPKTELLQLQPEQILKLSRSQFKALFRGTPIWRIGLKRLKRNARAVLKNQNQKTRGRC
ncbi:tRNA epoxyqueuosine(34) reductase QueG [Chlorobium phaeovibrioides]|uniref:tRNA epoxyqueuosine(34) reductase QueG n=1 Tax=Chlorobium phaeovibrioides TaxID=1094 RepID=A0A432AVI6_CHLPH|nr:tRNA epoxyqueuosine(34) reductase QueG [Chlorobium phaeovibrioides]KAA6232141.1 tRNA epoxyqueuosine(34) reductase QueG [Chlorobium phaeovibrioides]RTY38474.1 tRNA epoxyqueuosine(34) reductase QueG [Chlorobium phaeovibrioides]